MSNEEQLQLQRARDLIQAQQFDEARALLNTLAHHPTAQRWLAKMDERDLGQTPPAAESSPAPDPTPDPAATAPTLPGIDPDSIFDSGSSASAPPPVMASSAPSLPASPPRSSSVYGDDDSANASPSWSPPGNAPAIMAGLSEGLTESNIQLARVAITGFVILMGLIMLVGFFAFAWMYGEDENPDNEDINTLTAWELWIGSNEGEKMSMNLDLVFDPDRDSDNIGGFGDVRWLDRLLILLPLGALGLIGAAGVYFARSEQRLLSAAVLAGMAFALLVLPFAWQFLSTENWKSAYRDFLGDIYDIDKSRFDDAVEELTNLYDTGHQQMLGLLAFVAALGAVALEYTVAANQRPAATAIPGPASDPPPGTGGGGISRY